MLDDAVAQKLRAFCEERDWDQFHTPENLAKSISIEAAELLECFQWTSNGYPQAVKEELADDMAIPEEFRGIGVRIEDDVLVNADGSVTRMSEDIPRKIADVEEWIRQAQQRA